MKKIYLLVLILLLSGCSVESKYNFESFFKEQNIEYDYTYEFIKDRDFAGYSFYNLIIISEYFCGTEYQLYYDELESLDWNYLTGSYNETDNLVSIEAECNGNRIYTNSFGGKALYYGSLEIDLDGPSSSQVWYWIQDRYDYYDNLHCGGDYCGDTYADLVFSDAVEHFELTIEEINELYYDYEIN